MGRNIICQILYRVLKNKEKHFNMEKIKVEICTTIISQVLEASFPVSRALYSSIARIFHNRHALLSKYKVTFKFFTQSPPSSVADRCRPHGVIAASSFIFSLSILGGRGFRWRRGQELKGGNC